MRIGFFVVTRQDDPKSLIHIRLAEIMMKSARAVMPDVPIVQLTDGQTPRVVGVDECIRIADEMPMAVLRMTHQSRLEGEWLFVDPDVMFRRDVREVFDQPFDVAVCDRHGVGVNVSDDYAETMPHNTGVVFSRSPAFWKGVIEQLVQLPKKHQEWVGDQLVICNLVKTIPHVKYLPGKVYNFAPDDEQTDISGAAIVHYKGNRKDMMFMDKHLIIGGVGVPTVRLFAKMDNGERSLNMDIAMTHGFPVVDQEPEKAEPLSIVCYGPSLKATWRNIKRPMMTVSGAHDFMIENGVVPDYHMDCDPAEYKANFVAKPHKDVHYLMASCCDKKVWENLAGQKVTLWHAWGGDETDLWMRKHGRGQITIGGGSTAGLRAIMLGGVLGYRSFNIYGMDSSFADDGNPWSGVHYSKSHKDAFKVRCGTRWFKTSHGMIAAARQFEKLVRNNPQIECRLHGDGMLQEMLKTTGYEALCA